MSCYYFAYGSNMNQARMKARQMDVCDVLAGTLPGCALAFNKLAADAPGRSYANVVYAPESKVEGVLYQLGSPDEITRMDPFEGAPRYYSREIYFINTAEGAIPAWVYIANKAMIDNQLKPAPWYLDHLLAGREFLSEAYYQALTQVQCNDESPQE